MDNSLLKKIIENTFGNKFDMSKFTNFIVELLNLKSDEVSEAYIPYEVDYIPNTYQPYINSFEKIASYESDGVKLDVLIVKLKRKSSMERARTMQRNFIAWYLRGDCDGQQKDAALAAFVSPDEADWRFSYIKMDYSIEEDSKGRVKISEQFSPAKRWSFLVGSNEGSHTAQAQLLDILKRDDRKITLDQLEEAFNVEKVTKEFFAKYRELFFRTNEALEEIIADDFRVKAEFKEKDIKTSDFAKKLLGQIVFLYFLQKKGWFGVARDADWGTGPKNFLRELFEGKHGKYKNFYNDILEHLFYDALRNDRSYNDDYYSNFNCKIPFLNGGLFDPINNYDWVHVDIFLPNEIFSNNKPTKEEDTGNGILDIFDRYSFTVKEDEPLEKEVAVDPEMLGKVFENLLEVKDRRSKGTYYTPREIVHYMCQQSLLNYIKTKLEDKISSDDIEALIKIGEKIGDDRESSKSLDLNIFRSTPENAALIDEKLASVKVCDPAVGSGAFLVGMMVEIVRIRNVLSKYIKGPGRTNYNFKRECIENSLYGVDIDPGAVEIAKLRLWLSLVVDETNIKDIKPLPNLDYKIVCGDSLLSLDRQDMFVDYNLRQIEEIKVVLFNETNVEKKKGYIKKIDELICEITKGHELFDYEVYFSEVFREKKGFDIVIANPPYVQLQKLRGNPIQKEYKKQSFITYNATGDIYCLFYEKGMGLLKEKGHLCFISSNKWMRAGYGKKLREYFLNHNPISLIDLGSGVFETATVDTNIIIIQNNKNLNRLKAVTYEKTEKSLDEYFKVNCIEINKKPTGAWFIGSYDEQRLKEKIERIGKPLKEWDVKIYRGVLTGFNEAFIIDTPTKESLCVEDPKSAEILKPILRGRDIKRYRHKWAGFWLIQSGFDIDMPKKYPAVYKYLLQFEKRARRRDDQGKNWWNLRACSYYSEFEKEKIVYPNMTKYLPFLYDNEMFYTNQKCFIITGRANLKYLVGFFNSKISFRWIKDNCPELQGGTRELSKIFFENIPIPSITPVNKTLTDKIKSLVDKILQLKKNNPKSDISEFDKQIDQMVYELYSLTPKEIEIVENFK